MEQDDEIKNSKFFFILFITRWWRGKRVWNVGHLERQSRPPTDNNKTSSRQVQTRPTRLRRIFTPSRQDPKLMGQFNFQQSETKPTKKEHQVFAWLYFPWAHKLVVEGGCSSCRRVKCRIVSYNYLRRFLTRLPASLLAWATPTAASRLTLAVWAFPSEDKYSTSS